jgi:hypothetical protein
MASVLIENPCLALIAEAEIEDSPELFLQWLGQHRSDHLHPAGQVPVHPVGRTDVKFAIGRILLPRGEIKDAGVFEKAADDRTNSNAFRSPRNTRA